MNSDNQQLEELLRKMYAEETSQNGGHDTGQEIDTSRIIDEEWKKFEAQHFTPRRRTRVWRQIAAAFAGLLILSGIVYAAIYQPRHTTVTTQPSTTVQTPASDTHRQKQKEQIVLQDSGRTIAPKTFENVPLKDIVEELGKGYNFSVEVKNSKTAALRLYYPWNPQMPVTQVVEELNRFEKVRLTVQHQTIVIE